MPLSKPATEPVVSNQDQPNTPLAADVELEAACGRFVDLDVAAWVETFQILGLPFNADEYRREAGDAIIHAVKSALFFGGDMTMEDLRKHHIGLAHSKALIKQRIEMCRKYGTYEDQQKFRLVSA